MHVPIKPAAPRHHCARFYFDLREGANIIPDEKGLELPSILRVQEEAARSLADMARDAIQRAPGGTGHAIAIEVRDENGPIMQVQFTFGVNLWRRKI